MKLATKFFETTFEGETSREAYSEVCRWVADNVVKKDEIGETFWKIEKVKTAGLPTFKLELYATLESKDLKDSLCTRCQEFHKLFYLNQQYNCDACNMVSYLKQAEEKLRVKKHFRKGLIRQQLGE